MSTAEEDGHEDKEGSGCGLEMGIDMANVARIAKVARE